MIWHHMPFFVNVAAKPQGTEGKTGRFCDGSDYQNPTRAIADEGDTTRYSPISLINSSLKLMKPSTVRGRLWRSCARSSARSRVWIGSSDRRSSPSWGFPTRKIIPYQADMVLNALPGYMFTSAATGNDVVVPVSESGMQGHHGQLPTHPLMHATFVAVGAHIRPGTRIETIDAVDVAPTIAAILGLELPEASGRVLTEILR